MLIVIVCINVVARYISRENREPRHIQINFVWAHIQFQGGNAARSSIYVYIYKYTHIYIYMYVCV